MDFGTQDVSITIASPPPMEEFLGLVDSLIQNIETHGSFMSPALVTEGNNLIHLHFETFGMNDDDVEKMVGDVLTLAGFENTGFVILSNS
jgi:hypothetical protein